MTKLNFKTKKVTLPLDVNKTYVLVDVEEYEKYACDNSYYVNKHELGEPFTFSRVGSDYGYIGSDIIIGSGETEYEFFRELTSPESGDSVIMTETYSTGRYIAYDDKQHMHVINVDGVLVYVEDDEFQLKQEEPSWQEVLCEEFDIDYNKDADSFKFLRGYSPEGVIKLAKRIIELSGE